jgi:hypothetical protein
MSIEPIAKFTVPPEGTFRGEDNGPPMIKVPPVAAFQIPTCVTVTAGIFVNETAVEFSVAPPDATAKETDCRAYEPPVTSFAPVSPGSAVCSETYQDVTEKSVLRKTLFKTEFSRVLENPGTNCIIPL